MLTRTWKMVFDAMMPAETGPTQERWEQVGKDEAYNLIWHRPLFETEPEERV